MGELVDPHVSKICAERHVGSTPTKDTTVFISMNNIKVFEKLNEQKGKVLGAKMDEIDKLLKPYTITLSNGTEEVTIPNDEVARKWMKLNKEFQNIVQEIILIDKN